jgi:hypothetical protein
MAEMPSAFLFIRREEDQPGPQKQLVLRPVELAFLGKLTYQNGDGHACNSVGKNGD